MLNAYYVKYSAFSKHKTGMIDRNPPPKPSLKVPPSKEKDGEKPAPVIFDFLSFCKVLKKNRSVTQLMLGHNDIAPSMMKVLMAALRCVLGSGKEGGKRGKSSKTRERLFFGVYLRMLFSIR